MNSESVSNLPRGKIRHVLVDNISTCLPPGSLARVKYKIILRGSSSINGGTVILENTLVMIIATDIVSEYWYHPVLAICFDQEYIVAEFPLGCLEEVT